MRKEGLFVVVAVLALAGLFLWLRPAPPPAVPAAVPQAAAPAPGPRRVELVVREGRLASGPAVIRAVAGEQLLLRVTSDQADELHLHGYDLSLTLPAGQPAELRIDAERAGRFEYELHHAHVELGALEVQPR